MHLKMNICLIFRYDVLPQTPGRYIRKIFTDATKNTHVSKYLSNEKNTHKFFYFVNMLNMPRDFLLQSCFPGVAQVGSATRIHSAFGRERRTYHPFKI